jgi:plastocyanin
MKNSRGQVAVIGVIILVVIVIGAFFVLRPSTTENGGATTQETPAPGKENLGVEEKVVEESGKDETGKDGEVMKETGSNKVEMTNSGYDPKTLTISRGTLVNFVNTGTRSNWPASAVHPTHKAYPGSSISKCNTPERKNIFDACASVGPGDAYSFTFTEVGAWNYHDHTQASMWGTIIVE